MDWLLLDVVHPKLARERSILCPGAPSITQGDWGEPQFVSSVTELERVPGHVSSFSDDPALQCRLGLVTRTQTYVFKMSFSLQSIWGQGIKLKVGFQTFKAISPTVS